MSASKASKAKATKKTAPKQAPAKRAAKAHPKPATKAKAPAKAVKAAAKAAPAKSAAKPVAKTPAGPKGKPMSKSQLEHFRQRLMAEKQRVLEEMGELTSGTFMKSISDEAGENSRYSYHLGDVASLSYGREFSMGLAERQQNYLEQIDEALQRVQEGTYGICKVTGEQIPTERLEEVLVAKYSVRGKELLELQRRRSHEPHAEPERQQSAEIDDGGGESSSSDE
jgi:DnaK suppressor protein